MKPSKTVHVCSQCGSIQPKWVGKCPDCGAWNSFAEETVSKGAAAANKRTSGSRDNFQSLPDIERPSENRIFCGVPELDRVLGGGIVPGALMLLSGDPGIGKSTLLLQALYGLASRGYKVLYASGEESGHQIKLRADRLGTLHTNIFVSNETDIDLILNATESLKPQVLVVDSIQTMFDSNVASSPGSVTQIRECTNRLLGISKGKEISTWVVGHVTKEGNVAGPRVLEHLVDTVMYLEGDTSSGYRILRAVKNRFGSTGEIGVFEMRGSGLVDVPNPSGLFLEGHRAGVSGSAVGVSLEGTRPLLIEVQALVGNTTFSSPKRLVTGLDQNRFSILIAVLEKRGGLHLGVNDIYANVAGGLRISEPGTDLAAAAAVISSLLDRQFPGRFAYMGEVGLSGELRMVNQGVARIQEAQKMGFERLYLPKRNFVVDKTQIEDVLARGNEIQLYPLENVQELVNEFMDLGRR